MPIVTLQNQTAPQAAPNVQRQRTVSTVGESLGQGLGDVANVVTKIQQEEKLKADRAAFMDADRVTDTAANDLITSTERLRGKDAIGSSTKALEDFDKQSSSILNSLKSPRQKAAYTEAVNQRRSTLQRQIERHEGQETESYYAKGREDSKAQAHINAVTAYRDPKAIDEQIEKIRGFISWEPGTDQAQRDTELGVRRSGVYAGVIDRYLANDVINGAEQYYKTVRDKVNGDVATQIEARINAAKDREKNKRDASLAMAKADLQDEVRNIEAAARLRLPVEAVPSEARFVALYGDRGKKMHEQTQSMARLSMDAAKLDTLSTEKIVELAKGYIPKAAGGDTAAEAERAGIIGVQAKAVLYARQEDPVAYLQTYSPTVQESAAAFDLMPSDATRERYLSSLRAERQRLGIPGDEILSKGQVQDVIQRASQFSDTQKLTDSVRAEAERWGKDWPLVFMQAGDKMPDVAYYIGTGLSDKASDVVASTVGLTNDELAKRLPSGTSFKTIQEDTASDLEDFSLTFPIDGTAALAKMRKGNENLIVGYLGQGMSYSQSRKAAAKEINDKYSYVQFRDRPYRVPKSTAIDPDEIEMGTARILKKFQAPESAVPPGATVEQLSDVVRREGYWVTNEDESGLMLFYDGAPLGYPPVQYSWDQLATPGEAVPLSDTTMSGY